MRAFSCISHTCVGHRLYQWHIIMFLSCCVPLPAIGVPLQLRMAHHHVDDCSIIVWCTLCVLELCERVACLHTSSHCVKKCKHDVKTYHWSLTVCKLFQIAVHHIIAICQFPVCFHVKGVPGDGQGDPSWGCHRTMKHSKTYRKPIKHKFQGNSVGKKSLRADSGN